MLFSRSDVKNLRLQKVVILCRSLSRNLAKLQTIWRAWNKMRSYKPHVSIRVIVNPGAMVSWALLIYRKKLTRTRHRSEDICGAITYLGVFGCPQHSATSSLWTCQYADTRRQCSADLHFPGLCCQYSHQNKPTSR